MSEENIIQDIFLLDFYERKCNNILSVADDHTQYLLLKNLTTGWRSRLQNIKYKIMGPIPIVTSILRTFNGKISLVTPEILNIAKDFPPEINNFNFYLHSCTVVEALNIIVKCAEIIQGLIFFVEDRIIFLSLYRNIKVNIFYNVFKDRKAILRSIENVEERHGFDLEVGYFTTITSLLLLVIKDSVTIPDDDFTTIINDGEKELNVDKVRDRLVLLHHVKNSSRMLLSRYRRLNVGISDDVYVTLNIIFKKYNVNKDLLKYLCEILLRAQVLDTKQKLLRD